MRMDRTILTCKEFVRNTAEMGPPFVEPVTDTIEMIFDEMVGASCRRDGRALVVLFVFPGSTASTLLVEGPM